MIDYEILRLLNKSIEQLTLYQAFENENESLKFIRSKFYNETIKSINLNQFNVEFSDKDLHEFGSKFANARVQLNKLCLTVDKKIIYKKEIKEQEKENDRELYL